MDWTAWRIVKTVSAGIAGMAALWLFSAYAEILRTVG